MPSCSATLKIGDDESPRVPGDEGHTRYFATMLVGSGRGRPALWCSPMLIDVLKCPGSPKRLLANGRFLGTGTPATPSATLDQVNSAGPELDRVAGQFGGRTAQLSQVESDETPVALD